MKHHHRHIRPRHRSPNRRLVFWIIAALVTGVSLLFTSGLAASLFSLWGLQGPDNHFPARFPTVLCVIPIIFFIVTAFFGGLSFRHFGEPLADIISAAEAVARGDLSVRLPEYPHSPLANLARSFNHMTEELARTEQQRRNMTADIAHELRNPLHIIQGNLEGMLDGVYEPDEENLSATLDETRLLARLVSDLQTLSLAEAGQLPLHPTRFRVSDLLADVAASFAAQAAEQQIQLQMDVAENVRPLELYADYDRLDQVLSNLVSNAMRYTPANGQIRLAAEAIAGSVRISVADSGAGIPAEDLPYIFDRFWKGDPARKRESGAGSGLGLAIARQLVRAHGGELQVESEPGKRTIFIIEMEQAA